MKMNQTLLTSAALAGMTLLSSGAFAQDPEEAPMEEAPADEPVADVPAEEPAPMQEAPVVEQPTPEPEPEPVVEPAPEPTVTMEGAEVSDLATDEPPEEEAGGASLFVFADGYAAFQTTKSGTCCGGGVYSSVGPDGTAQSGFGLNWLGVDFGYDGGKWGVTGSLRAGDALYQYGVGTLGGSIDGVTAIGITNAFATWKPVDGLKFDLGTFGTIYGAEVAESWNNLNYTRGELYFNYQPFWHTGLRAEYAPGDFVIRALVVNDPNSSNLNTGAVNGGLQLGYANDNFGLFLGGLQTFAPKTSAAYSGFLDTFFDVVLTVNAGGFSLIGNFDLNVGYETTDFWGASLAAGYAFTDAFGVALRGEYLSTANGALFGTDDNENLTTLTLTLDTKPTGAENFVVRWDNRVEFASESAYGELDGTGTDSAWFSSTLGVVAYADLL